MINLNAKLQMSKITLFICIISLLTTVPCFSAIPSLKTVNDGVNPDALKELPVEFNNCQEIIFVQRGGYSDPHWYANIGYFCDDEKKTAYASGAQLCKLNLKTHKVSILLETDKGCIRDPKVHYDGEKIIFAWRKDSSEFYHLYEMDLDGNIIRQITSGPYNDYEPEYLPDGGIVFISTRARRWVGCWMTQVGNLHRCDGDGQNIKMLSSNIEQDNTPSVLHNGQILYMRWEYVDRSQVEFHHLWTMNPDGTNQAIYYGNQVSGGVFLSCRPIPNDDRVIGIYSPGHGRRDHYGWLSFFSSKYGPDAKKGLNRIPFARGMSPLSDLADPWPMSTKTILVADKHKSRLLIVEKGSKKYTDKVVYEIKDNHAKWLLQSPRPVIKRQREKVISDRTDWSQAVGYQVLIDVYNSRNMKGIKRGEIKKLLIIETLPKPVNFSGGPDTISWLGTFTLERILGTVPVEADGSAYFELPANRPVFYVALDEKDLSCKRMHSFTSVMPGEMLTCLGCHEDRRQVGKNQDDNSRILALQRKPSKITPIKGVPDVPDFIRDIQPVLDKYCVKCHNTEKRAGRLSLAGDMGHSLSLSYLSLIFRNEIVDGRNGLGNRASRSVGSSASKLLRRLEGSHHDVKAEKADWIKVWAWIEAAAPFCGTYGGLRNGSQHNTKKRVFLNHANAVLEKRCHSCHDPKGKGPQNKLLKSYDMNKRKKHFKRKTGQYERLFLENDSFRYFGWPVLLNGTRPSKSAVLAAPLAKDAGGWGICPDVFMSKDDKDYQILLDAACEWQKEWLKAKRFGTPQFQVNHQYIREMVRFGILDKDTPADKVDPYETDRRYWQLFNHAGVLSNTDNKVTKANLP